MFTKIVYKFSAWIEKYRIAYLCNQMKLGKSVIIKSGLKVSRPRKITIHDNVSIHNNCTLQAQARITIGKNSLIAANCTIVTANHDVTKRGVEAMHAIERKAVNIGEGCWLGVNVVILPGVTIGNNAVIAAGSVVTRDMPENMICMGTPAKPIKERPLA